jgi:hypothetical protein
MRKKKKTHRESLEDTEIRLLCGKVFATLALVGSDLSLRMRSSHQMLVGAPDGEAVHALRSFALPLSFASTDRQ